MREYPDMILLGYAGYRAIKKWKEEQEAKLHEEGKTLEDRRRDGICDTDGRRLCNG